MGSTIDGGFWKTSTKKESTIDKAITPSFAVVGGLEDSVRVEGFILSNLEKVGFEEKWWGGGGGSGW